MQFLDDNSTMTLPNSSGGFVVLESVVDIYYWGKNVTEKSAYVGKTNTSMIFTTSKEYTTKYKATKGVLSNNQNVIYFLQDTGEVVNISGDLDINYSGVKLGCGVTHVWGNGSYLIQLSTSRPLMLVAKTLSFGTTGRYDYYAFERLPTSPCSINLSNVKSGTNYILASSYNMRNNTDTSTWTFLVQDVLIQVIDEYVSFNGMIQEKLKLLYENSNAQKVFVCDEYGVGCVYDTATQTIDSTYLSSVVIGELTYNETYQYVSSFKQYYNPSTVGSTYDALDGDFSISLKPILNTINNLKYDLKTNKSDLKYFSCTSHQGFADNSLNICTVEITNDEDIMLELEGNIVVSTDDRSDIVVQFVIDSIPESFTFKTTVDGYDTLHINHLFSLPTGTHIISAIIQGSGYIEGTDIHLVSSKNFEATENTIFTKDYTFDGSIIQSYIGTDKRVQTPTINDVGNTVSQISNSCFRTSDVTDVVISDGIVIIL